MLQKLENGLERTRKKLKKIRQIKTNKPIFEVDNLSTEYACFRHNLFLMHPFIFQFVGDGRVGGIRGA